MTRHLLFAAAVVLPTASAIAQPATAPVQVSVVGAVQLTREGITDFGPVPNQPQTRTINPAAPTGAQQAARFTATGAAGATIVLTWASTLDLCHETAGCGTTIPFTPSLTRFENPFQQFLSTPIASGESAVLSGSGNHYFWLGGSITVPVDPMPGVYRGDFTLTAEYQ